MLDTNKPLAPQRRSFFLRLVSYLPGGLLLAPLGFLIVRAFSLSQELMVHVSETLLAESVLNSVFLLAGVLLFTGFFGVSTAWLLARFEFRFARFWRWALLLALSVPAYVVSFIWISWMDFSGLVPTFLRTHFDMQNTPPVFSQFRSMGGLLVPLTFSLFPYVYLLALEGFETQNRAYFEAARSLGLRRRARLFRLHLPLMAPWVLSGLLLVGMETLADFGSVSVFNIQVFTTLVYRSWFALQSIETASFFAIAHVVFLVAFVLLISKLIGRGRVSDAFAGRQTRVKARLSTAASLGANLVLSLLWSLSFLLPTLQLCVWTLEQPARLWDTRFLERVFNSFSIATMTALATLMFAIILLLARRFLSGRDIMLIQKIPTLGYGIPGTVIAVGWMASLTLLVGSTQSMPWLALLTLVLGLATRFVALAQRPIENASDRISRSIEETSLSSGMSVFETLKRVHFPLLKNAFGIAFVFVFVDVLKEMPMTLLMRPYGWDTLAVRVYQFTSDGLWHEAAPASLVIILASVLPIILMRKRLQ